MYARQNAMKFQVAVECVLLKNSANRLSLLWSAHSSDENAHAIIITGHDSDITKTNKIKTKWQISSSDDIDKMRPRKTRKKIYENGKANTSRHDRVALIFMFEARFDNEDEMCRRSFERGEKKERPKTEETRREEK